MPSTQTQPVLVAVAEPSNQVQLVMERAAQLASALDAPLILFHAAFESVLSGRPFFDSRRLAQSRGWVVAERTRQLERHAAALRRRGIDTEVRVGWEEPAHEAILRAAIRADAGLVVAGPHEFRPDRAPGLKFTDWELLRLCPRALLLVRSAPMRSSPGGVLVALDPTHAYDKPAALDAELARQAHRMASALGVQLHAVHCIPLAAYAFGDDTAAGRKRMRERLQKKLHRVLRGTGASDARIQIIHGLPEAAIPQLAERLRSQLLVMGTISRRGMRRFVVGNTAERIIDRSPCDLLIVKPKGFKLRLGRSRKQSIIVPQAARRAVSG